MMNITTKMQIKRKLEKLLPGLPWELAYFRESDQLIYLKNTGGPDQLVGIERQLSEKDIETKKQDLKFIKRFVISTSLPGYNAYFRIKDGSFLRIYALQEIWGPGANYPQEIPGIRRDNLESIL